MRVEHHNDCVSEEVGLISPSGKVIELDGEIGNNTPSGGVKVVGETDFSNKILDPLRGFRKVI